MNREFAYGADIGWLSQLEAMGIRWVDERMQTADPICELKRFGTNAARLRVFVDPPENALWQKNSNTVCMLGFADAKGLLISAKRVHEAGLRLMIDFHYSDHFADPEIQDIPEAWRLLDDTELRCALHDHTAGILKMLRDNNIEPEWVQVGNEINHGFMWPRARLKEEPRFMTELLNTGYDAVKEVFPDCSVVTHLACLQDRTECLPFLDAFYANGGKTDILGFSFYPYWFDAPYDVHFIREQMAYYADRYRMPLIISEIGGKENDQDQTYEIVKNTVDAAKLLPAGTVRGVFYWEPCAGADFLPDHYPLGASVTAGSMTLQFNRTLRAFRGEA